MVPQGAVLSAVFPPIERILNRRHEFLLDLNHAVTDFLAAELKVECGFELASELGVTGSGQGLLVAICSRLGADTYVSGPLGRDYIDDEEFRAAGIELYYHEYDHPAYPQLFDGFQPYMSAIDLLFNCGDESFGIMSQGNATREEVRERSCSGSTSRR